MPKVILASLAMACAAAAHAQATVYKCSSHSYSEQPCSTRIVRTDEAPVDPPTRRHAAVASQRLPGESADQFAARRRRARLAESDRDECARLDTRIPFEQERLRTAVQAADEAQAKSALGTSLARARKLHC